MNEQVTQILDKIYERTDLFQTTLMLIAFSLFFCVKCCVKFEVVLQIKTISVNVVANHSKSDFSTVLFYCKTIFCVDFFLGSATL